MKERERLGGLCALVTGGGTGIGLAIAKALAASGCRVAIAGRRFEVLLEAVRELEPPATGPPHTAVAGDVAHAEQAIALVETAVERLGGLHILVNNAGVARYGPFGELAHEEIHQLVDVDLKGPVFMTHAALPHLSRHREKNGASVLNISSSVTFMALKNYAVYSAAKAGVDMLTRCLALELAEQRIRVNAIAPGVVETPIFATMLGDEAASEMLSGFGANVPLGRVGQPDDIARMALVLCDPANDWITGAVIPVDGGLSLGPND